MNDLEFWEQPALDCSSQKVMTKHLNYLVWLATTGQ